MNRSQPTSMLEPRFETAGTILAGGFRRHYTAETMDRLPQQWQVLAAQMHRLPPQKQRIAYGICFDRPTGIDYVTAFDVASFADLGEDWERITLPPNRYAVFSHDGDVTTLRSLLDAIWHRWLPQSGHKLANGKEYFFERYGPGFDPRAGKGDIEVWIPIEA